MKRKVNPKVNGYSNVHRLAKKARKRKESEGRVEEWRKLSPQQQLEALDKAGLTATKQRRRIEKCLKQS